MRRKGTFLRSLPGHTTATSTTSIISPNSLLDYGSIDVGMQEFLPVIFHSLILLLTIKSLLHRTCWFRLLA